MIFHFMTAQSFVAEHYENDFDTIFHFRGAQKLKSSMLEILRWPFTLRQLKTWLKSTMQEIFTWSSTFKTAQNLVAVAEHHERDFDVILIFRACAYPGIGQGGGTSHNFLLGLLKCRFLYLQRTVMERCIFACFLLIPHSYEHIGRQYTYPRLYSVHWFDDILKVISPI